MADLCVYWIRRAHDLLPSCTPSDSLIGRAGLVGTQNIRSNESRVGGLDYVASTGTIVEAVDTQPWSGEANVHVSIANWVKSQNAEVLPSKRRLWFRSAKPLKKAKRPKGSGPASKEYDLDMREVAHINSALSNKTDLKDARALSCNSKPKRTFQGITPGHEDFVLDNAEAKALISKEKAAADLLFPYFVGKEVLGGVTTPRRQLLDFGQRDLLSAKAFPKAMQLVETKILPKRLEAAQKGTGGDDDERSHHTQFLEKWWQLSYRRTDLLDALSGLKRYLACSRVTSRPIMFFVSANVRPGDALQVFAFEDDYSFGVLQSSAHIEWFMNKRSNMKSDPRYSSTAIFGTFPWPQRPTRKQIEFVADASRKLQVVRNAALANNQGGLRRLYDTLNLPGKNPLKEAHAALDSAVLDAYGFAGGSDLLKEILDLNKAVAADIAAARPVTAPGIPIGYFDPASLSSTDCIGG